MDNVKLLTTAITGADKLWVWIGSTYGTLVDMVWWMIQRMPVALTLFSWNSHQLWICLHQHRCTRCLHFENCLLYMKENVHILHIIMTANNESECIRTIRIFSKKAISPFLSRQQFIMINVAIKMFCKHTRAFFWFYNLSKISNEKIKWKDIAIEHATIHLHKKSLNPSKCMRAIVCVCVCLCFGTDLANESSKCTILRIIQ